MIKETAVCLSVCLRLMAGQTGEHIGRDFLDMGGLKDGECFRLGFMGAEGERSEPM